MTRRQRRAALDTLGALAGVVAPLLFVAAVATTSALRPGYSQTTQFISELGETGGPYAGLMNGAGFVASGLLLAAFALWLGTRRPRAPIAWVAAALVALFGLGAAGAGLFPCDAGCPPQGGSLSNRVHNGISAAAFLCAVAGFGLWAVRFRRLPAWRPLGAYSALSSAAALVFLVAMIRAVAAGGPAGLWQRLFVGSVLLWFLVVALHALHALHALRRGADARPPA